MVADELAGAALDVTDPRLLPADHKHVDPICGAFEICVKVKAYKVGGAK